MLWLRRGFGFSGGWTVNDQNDLLARFFDLQRLKNRENGISQERASASEEACDKPDSLSMNPVDPLNRSLSLLRYFVLTLEVFKPPPEAA